MPKLINTTYIIDNFASLTVSQDGDTGDLWGNVTKSGRYFIISGTQTMSAGTRFTVGVV